MEDEGKIGLDALRGEGEQLSEVILSQRIKDGDSCVICLEQVSERAIALPCRHTNFDFLCLLSWLQERSSCPLCNSDVRLVDYDCLSSNGYKTYKVPQVIKSSSTANSTPNAPFDAQYHNRLRSQRASRGPQRNTVPSTSSIAENAILRRRAVYQQNLYSSHVGSNRLSKYQILTPQLVARDKELVSRARKWIRRELKVFEFLNPDEEQAQGTAKRASNAEFLLEYIIAILKTVDIKGAGGQAEDMLQEFLGREKTRLFLHELRAWLRSPYKSVEDWDRHVQYAGNLGVHVEKHEHQQRPVSSRRPRQQSHTQDIHQPDFWRPTADRYSPYNDDRSMKLNNKDACSGTCTNG